MAYSTGSSQREIAARHGISTKTVQRALKRHRENRSLAEEREAWYVVERYLQRVDALISDLAVEIRRATEPADRIRGLAAQTRLFRSQREALIDAGVLPKVDEPELRKEMRAEHGAQIYSFLKQKLGARAPEVSPWLGESIEEWINLPDPGPLSRERDTFRQESVLWNDQSTDE